MFVYLSKRIAIPNGTSITSIAWNEDGGWLACGGTGGLLKVLKVDGGAQGQKTGGLSVNQTLEGHDSAVNIVAWNQQYNKLTSADERGRIIVWTLHKGMWFEEMVNNRNKSTVVDLSWNADGTNICIAYADGAVIVGGVDGDRLWGTDLKYELAKVCWSPDSGFLLFGTKSGDVYVHNGASGAFISQMNIMCEGLPSPLAGVRWSPAWVERPEPKPTLAVCYQSGQLQLTDSVGDENAYLVETGMPVQCVAWNPQGTTFVICGLVTPSPETSVVVSQFYNGEGIHLRTLRVAGKRCGGITWEGDGLRVAIAVDSSVYFANVRPKYRYCYFESTVVFAFNKPDKLDDSVMFWNIRTNERTVKQIRDLVFLAACRDACVTVNSPIEFGGNQACTVQLHNAIGSPIATRTVDLDPFVCAMNSSHVICCGDENIYIWQFRDPSVKVDALDPVSVQASRSTSHERIIHIDDIVRGDSEPAMTIRSAITNDLISAVCLSEDYLFVARESATLHVYALQPLRLVAKYMLPARVQTISANCDSSYLAVVDLGGVLRVYAMEKDKFSLVPRKAEPHAGVERKDVWNIMWASDDASRLAVMEKTRLVLFNNFVAEEPVTTSVNLCEFDKLVVRGLQVDELMADPERPKKDSVIDFECRDLRDTREAIERGTVKEAFQYVAALDKAPAKLFDTVAQEALKELDFTYAEMAFIRSRDYPSLQFLKRVRALDHPKKQMAEIHAYYGRYDTAEALYKELDRKDLALEMRQQIGDWFGVVRLVQEGGGDESLLLKAWEHIGDHYADHHKWTKASQYYTQCRHYRKLARVFYLMEDYEMLEQLINMAEHDKELLLTLGRMFLSVGLADAATRAQLAAGEPRLAVDGCVQLNKWDRAIELAAEHHLDDVSKLLNKYAQYLLHRDRLPEAIELYRKAGQHHEAAKLLAKLGQKAAETDALKAKQFYVLSALEVERYRKQRMTLGKEGAEAVDELLSGDQVSVTDRTLDAAWRGAEAYHFFLLCQKHVMEGSLPTALVLAMRLTEYDDVIAPVDSYSLIALTAYLAGNYGICSKAFTRLEAAELNDEASKDGATVGPQVTNFSMDLDVTSSKTMSSTMAGTMAGPAGGGGSAMSGTTTALQLTNPAKGVSSVAEFTYPTVTLKPPSRQFADLAVKIFTQHRPVDTSVDSIPCQSCGTFNKEWASQCVKCQHRFGVCIASGRCLVSEEDAWECTACHHKAVDTEVDRFKNCPLCHAPKKQRTRRR